MENLEYYLDKDILNLFESKNVDLSLIKIDVKNPAINIVAIAEQLGCSIKYEFLLSKAGSHDFYSKEITVNALDPLYRQRFTIAHEIGHNIYDHTGVRNRITQNQNASDEDRTYVDMLIERQANNFASKLLMPQKLVKEVEQDLVDAGEIRNERQRVTKLAEKFNVSYISMEYRLRALKQYE